jgi:hypothetical protein
VSAIGEARDLIGARLPDDGEGHPSAPIYAEALALGISERTLRRAARDLGVEHERLRQPRSPVMWRFPPLLETPPLASVDVSRRDAA